MAEETGHFGHVALRAEGTVGAPVLAGRATLSDAEYRNALYGVRVFNMNGSVVGNGVGGVVVAPRAPIPDLSAGRRGRPCDPDGPTTD